MKSLTRIILILVGFILMGACRQVEPTNTIDTVVTEAATMTRTPLPPTSTTTPVPDTQTPTATPTATSTHMPATTTPTQQAASDDPSSEIGIANFRFGPGELEVKAGTKVTWTNQDGTRHTVTSDDDVFDSGSMENGGTFSFTFNEAGTFTYHCNFHPGMVGTVIVTP